MAASKKYQKLAILSSKDKEKGKGQLSENVLASTNLNKPHIPKGPRFIDLLIESQESSHSKFSQFLLPSSFFTPHIKKTPDGSSGLVEASEVETIDNKLANPYQYGITEEEIHCMGDMVKKILSMDMASQKQINLYNKRLAMKHLQAHSRDSGTTEVQIGVLTVRILYMMEHLKKHRKDFSVQRKVVQLIQTRRKLLKYLKSQSLERYFEMMGKLNLKYTELV